MADLDFEQIVGGIEDAILQVLANQMEGVKHFDTYSGELDSDNLKRALGQLSSSFPLVLVSYTDGKDTEDPKVSAVGNRPLHYRQDCSFAVICVSTDARGEKTRRRGKTGVYKMLAQVRDILSGLRFKAEFENEDDEKEEFLLTNQPLKPNGIECIARLPNITAYATFFDTYFRFSTKNRSVPGTAVETIELDLKSTSRIDKEISDVVNDEVETNNAPANVPGVTKEKK